MASAETFTFLLLRLLDHPLDSPHFKLKQQTASRSKYDFDTEVLFKYFCGGI